MAVAMCLLILQIHDGSSSSSSSSSSGGDAVCHSAVVHCAPVAVCIDVATAERLSAFATAATASSADAPDALQQSQPAAQGSGQRQHQQQQSRSGRRIQSSAQRIETGE
jgi:hypothetical protein